MDASNEAPREQRILTGVGGPPRTLLAVDVELSITSTSVDAEQLTARLDMTPNKAFAGSSTHYWMWKPPPHIPRELNAQLNAVWAETSSRQEAFQALEDRARSTLVIRLHATPGFRLICPALLPEHLEQAASLRAQIVIHDLEAPETDDA